MSAIDIPFHVGDFAFLKDRVFFANVPGHERLAAVWQVHQDGRIELYTCGSHGRERFEVNYFANPDQIRKPNETEGRMIASAWFSVSSATGAKT